ncbi:alpha-1,4-glucan--maltose-1-phosphate maltosyltransferase [Rhizobium paknamense]|uniref:Alpha-1,4-glucan:maltose-1-phosphate maltosyltransferase n=1 Tax=Rhizobium paknamense TaxID=1206817 RepID=A0ABU0IBB1_9HYPH|nr:alpha-1,4-glucan--maltose-1-phosphate maltosyltransferase [Rhizobium paknamense]MDQ0454581.1 starch synthase (maltosyl-transferring) [Rhizobium paknamense]
MDAHARGGVKAGAGEAPRLYYVHPLMLGGIADWRELFHHARSLGFDSVLTAPLFQRREGTSLFISEDFERLDPALGLGEDVRTGLQQLRALQQETGIDLFMDVAPGRLPDPSPAIAADPRPAPQMAGSHGLEGLDETARENHLTAWRIRLAALAESGIAGFRCLDLLALAPQEWRTLIAGVTASHPRCRFYAWTPGTPFELRRSLAHAGFAGAFSSLAWWDGEERWLLDETEVQRDFPLQIAMPEAPFGPRVAHGAEGTEVLERRARQALTLAAAHGGGLMVPMGFEFGVATPLDPLHGEGLGLKALRDRQAFDLSGSIRRTNESLARSALTPPPSRLISASGTSTAALITGDHPDLRHSERLRVILFNRDLRRSSAVPFQALSETCFRFLPLTESGRPEQKLTADLRLAPGDVRIFEGTPASAVRMAAGTPALEAARTSRLVIENITPSVDGGRFPVKRVVGQMLTVEADLFGEGHDPISAALLWRAADQPDWTEVPMQLLVNDRWRGEFPLERLGRHEFAVECWRNPFAIFRSELQKKHEARLDLTLEQQEGLILIREAMEAATDPVKTALQRLIDEFEQADAAAKTSLLLHAGTFALMQQADRRPFRLRSAAVPVDAERREASFSSWYQIFPRSQSGDPHRHGTFDDVIARLPAIRAMGFDTLYFPPIHPIGTTNRKGRNNSLKAGPEDPGSPYAIGSEAGGHDAIHPQLGTFEDFRRLITAASEHGLEIALDLAIQASPDHPWLTQHPGWFDWRPDGSIRYAENPPKKYEDIVNVDFYARDAVPGLWQSLKEIVELWVDQGVKVFRVDNPHTKPFPFWEWLIAEIRARNPEVIFLSEAFTRPKVMYRLAKIGFSQSYTYFTWRNAKWELEQYMREITEEAPKEFFRPHFFVNTHDINPDFLQNAPRPAFVIRAALAATLSGLWGVYNGFELCEGRPDAKRKEYADSEKYEIRAWDWDRPGNIKGEITQLNRIRRDNPALHSHLGLTLLNAWNDQVMFFEKASAGRENVLLIAISLDPHHAQEADVEIPLWSWNLPDHASLPMEDLLTGRHFTWTGKRQHLRLTPEQPFAIWRVR